MVTPTDSCWGWAGSQESQSLDGRWDQIRGKRVGAEEQLKILLIRLDVSFHPSLKPSAPCLPEGNLNKMIERSQEN